MGKLNLNQGSESWHKWRASVIGASDVAKIMGVCPYGTAYSLYMEKTGRKDPPVFNENMSFGQKMEPIIRSAWERIAGQGFMPAVYQHHSIPYLAASLDGISMDEKIILEIKATNKKVFAEANKGVCVPWYFIQVQVQLMCVENAEYADVVFFNKQSREEGVSESDLRVVKVFPCEETIAEILEKTAAFRECIITDTAPEMCDRDYIYLGDDPFFKMAEDRWEKAYMKLKSAEAEEEEAKKRLILASGSKSSEGLKVVIQKITRKGSVDWKGVCEDKKIEDEVLEKHRKKSIEFFKPRLKNVEES